MDEKTYKIVRKVFLLIGNKRTDLSDSEVSYVLGLLETVIEYNSEDDPGKKKGMLDKFKA